MIAPKKNRAKVKVIGPMNSIPTACATNAVPQITEAIKRSKLPFKVFKVFITYLI